MPVVRRIVAGIAGVALAITMTACGPAPANESLSETDSQTVVAVSAPQELQDSGEVVWARVPYCECLSGSATDNVAAALEKEKLTVSLKEQSPRDGWLYFVVTFDSPSITLEQVGAAIVAGGGQVLEGPP